MDARDKSALWRKRAKALRAIADTFALASRSREELLKVARQWNRIADKRETLDRMWESLGRLRPAPQRRRRAVRMAPRRTEEAAPRLRQR